MEGRIDVVRPDGLIEGWCWNEQSPESRLSVTVLIDGIEAGSCLAAQYRDDLRQAKIGDGFYAFSFVTQTLPRSDKRTSTYALIETSTRAPIGAPLVVQNEPLGMERQLRDIVAATTRAHRPIVLPVPERPLMTILLQAGASLSQLHACLTALQRAGVGSIASVVVMDGGQAPDCVLAPSIVRGIRYIRTVTELTVEWADAERAGATDLVMMLSGRAVVSENFLREIVGGFANNCNAGAIGGHAMASWGAMWGGGFCLSDGTLKDCVNTGHPEAKAELSGSYPAHALSYQAVAFRRSAIQGVGGLDSAFGNDLGAAVIDLCFRLRRRGWSVLGLPSATLELQSGYGDETWVPRGVDAGSRAAELLRAHWRDSPLPHPPLFIGHAAVLGLPGRFRDELFAVHRLRERGYSVEYFGPKDMPAEDARDLRRAGSRITAAEAVGSELHACGATIIYAAESSAMLNLVPEGSRVVIGHWALNQAHASADAIDLPGQPGGFADEQRARQVAGL